MLTAALNVYQLMEYYRNTMLAVVLILFASNGKFKCK